MTSTTVKSCKAAHRNPGIRNVAASLMLAAAASMATGEAHAYDLQANTIYAHASGDIYAIDIDTAAASASATKVAEMNASLSSVQDITFDGSTMYGINLHWQLVRLEPNESESVAVKNAESYSLQFQGLAVHDGVLYGAETRQLLILDKATGDPVTGTDLNSYGLGAGELVTDLAFAADGTLYASVQFPGIPYSYLGTISTETGELMLLGNTGVEYVIAITVKDDVIYAMDRAGDLYTLNEVSGFSALVASDVLPGVTGMGTSPTTMMPPVDGSNNGSDSSASSGEAASTGGLSAYWMMLVALMLVFRRTR